MSQFNPSAAVRAAKPDVFTGLLLVATILLLGGVAWMVLTNTEYSKTVDGQGGGPLELVDGQ
ncbi:MAG: hypothetical protein QGH76_04365 [Phycisphaerales bacterium]|jgi:hypothetical protein|nr:hypothetical protein [Phycisphaerales bacterium]